MRRFHERPGRRSFMGGAAAAAIAGGTVAAGLSPLRARASDEETIDLGFPGGVDQRSVTTAFPDKAPMILQRTRPPLLETPFEVFDKSLITPNELFYVRWHWSDIPTMVDAESFRLRVRGRVNTTLSLSLKDLLALPAVELVAVNQCSGNSRGFFQPRVPGAQWGNGSMGNATWTGVRLRDVLDRAGVEAGAVAVRFNGLDGPVTPDGPDFMKSLAVDHARDGEVMVAYAMNGRQLPLLNGFPLRLVVPGWFATYWVKMLDDIEVLDGPDDSFWMAKSYLIPDTPRAAMQPGQAGVKMVPINRMVPRSFFTSVRPGDRVEAGAPVTLRGIAFGGDAGVARVDVSFDGGGSWQPARLGKDIGKYSLRSWEASFTPPRGAHELRVRCTNSEGEAQQAEPIWNPSGFMRSAIEGVTLVAA